MTNCSTPTAAQKRKLVRLLAAYINKDGATLRAQQKSYSAWMAYFETLEKMYPKVDFRSDKTIASLTYAAKKEATKKLFRGPGATF